MRALLLTTERRWSDVLKALLTGQDDIVVLTAGELAKSPLILPAVEVCFVADSELGQDTVDTIAFVKGAAAALPIFVFYDRSQGPWEEEIILAGAHSAFPFPIRAKLLKVALERARPRLPSLGGRSLPQPGDGSPVPAPRLTDNGEVLSLLRDLSRLLVHAGDGPLFVDAYLKKLREVLRCARMVLYLADSGSPDRKLKCHVALGVDPSLFASIRLTQTDGLGSILANRAGIVLRTQLREENPLEAVAIRELNVFGVNLAVPLVARDGLVGALLIGPKIAGADFSESELTLLFHLMEELGGIIRNTELHSALLRERRLFSSMLTALPVACAVLNSELRLVHLNSAMRRQLHTTIEGTPTFHDLPGPWAAAAYAVLQGSVEKFEQELDYLSAAGLRRVRLRVGKLGDDDGHEVLMVVEDITDQIRAQRDASQVRAREMLRHAGARISNDLRNALTPFSTAAQLVSSGGRHDLSLLKDAMTAGMHRLQRRVDDLSYISRISIIPGQTTAARVLAEARNRLECFTEDANLEQVRWPGGVSEIALLADERAVALALAELVANALDAAQGKNVDVVVEGGLTDIRFIVRNPGNWTPPYDPDGLGTQPFITEKPAGLGIGLEVARSVAETHGGDFRIRAVPGSETIEAELRVELEPAGLKKML